jgi:hypothetical protein
MQGLRIKIPDVDVLLQRLLDQAQVCDVESFFSLGPRARVRSAGVV